MIYSGETDTQLTGKLVEWAGETSLHHWVGHGNDINGTEGMVWQPLLEQNDKIAVFISDAQR